MRCSCNSRSSLQVDLSVKRSGKSGRNGCARGTENDIFLSLACLFEEMNQNISNLEALNSKKVLQIVSMESETVECNLKEHENTILCALEQNNNEFKSTGNGKTESSLWEAHLNTSRKTHSLFGGTSAGPLLPQWDSSAPNTTGLYETLTRPLYLARNSFIWRKAKNEYGLIKS